MIYDLESVLNNALADAGIQLYLERDVYESSWRASVDTSEHDKNIIKEFSNVLLMNTVIDSSVIKKVAKQFCGE